MYSFHTYLLRAGLGCSVRADNSVKQTSHMQGEEGKELRTSDQRLPLLRAFRTQTDLWPSTFPPFWLFLIL